MYSKLNENNKNTVKALFGSGGRKALSLKVFGKVQDSFELYSEGEGITCDHTLRPFIYAPDRRLVRGLNWGFKGSRDTGALYPLRVMVTSSRGEGDAIRHNRAFTVITLINNCFQNSNTSRII